MNMPKEMYFSNLTVHDVVDVLKNNSIAAREHLETLMDEDENLYSESELERLRYWKITIEEIFPNEAAK